MPHGYPRGQEGPLLRGLVSRPQDVAPEARLPPLSSLENRAGKANRAARTRPSIPRRGWGWGTARQQLTLRSREKRRLGQAWELTEDPTQVGRNRRGVVSIRGTGRPSLTPTQPSAGQGAPRSPEGPPPPSRGRLNTSPSQAAPRETPAQHCLQPQLVASPAGGWGRGSQDDGDGPAGLRAAPTLLAPEGTVGRRCPQPVPCATCPTPRSQSRRWRPAGGG